MKLAFPWSFAARVCAVAFVVVGATQAAFGALTHDPALRWKSLYSAHFVVHYHDGEEALARTAIAVAEQTHARLGPVFKWTPAGRTEIILTDRFDGPNGYATPVPTNRMGIYVNAPDEIDGLEDHGGWLETVITHEYAHILHLDKASGGPRFLRSVFGRAPIPLGVLVTFPNAYQPTWLIEGLAAYLESDPARGIGRGQSAYFNMLMRMEVAQGVKPLRQVNQPISSWPAGATPYLYGVEFNNFVAAQKDPKKIMQLVENYSDDILPFFINRNSKKVFRQNLSGMWDEFAQYLKQKHEPVLAAVDARGVRAGARITDDGYIGGPARALADGTLIYIRNDGRSEPRLMIQRPGKPRAKRLAYVHYGARFDVHPSAGVLVAQPERYRNTNVYYDLYRVDLKSGSTRRLTRAGRYRFATWNPDGSRIAAAFSENGRQALHLLDARGRKPEVIAEMGADEIISGLDWSPDGKSIAAAIWRPRDGWNIESLDVTTRQWQALTRDGALEGQPQFSADGASILFTSDQGGIYNLRRLDVASRAVTTLTDVKGGAFYPTANADAVYYTGYTAQGFDIYRLAQTDVQAQATPPVAAGASATIAAAPPLPPDLRESKYRPWNSVAPRWWFPHLVVDEDRSEVGVITAGNDTLNRHLYAVDVAYDFSQKNFIGTFDYIYDRWYPVFKLHADRESDFRRDNEGNVQRVRREDTFQAEVALPFLFHRRDFSMHLSALEERASDADVAPGVIAQPKTTDKIAGAALAYDSTRRYPLSISPSHGRQLALVAEDSDAFARSDYTGEVYTFDWREFVPLFGENVFAWRFVEGWGTQAPRPFELGGVHTANETSAIAAVVSTQTNEMLFNQREYAVRGYPRGLPQLTDRRMMLGSAEWRFPIRRIERGFMVPFPGGLDQLHGAVFVDSGAVWHDGSSPDKFYTGAGTEVSADLVLFYQIPLQLRAGYAHGFDTGGKDQVYLRLGASF